MGWNADRLDASDERTGVRRERGRRFPFCFGLNVNNPFGFEVVKCEGPHTFSPQKKNGLLIKDMGEQLVNFSAKTPIDEQNT